MKMAGSTGNPTSTSTPKSPTVLASGAEEVGAPTPAEKSPVDPQTGKGDLGTDDLQSGDAGIKPGSVADQNQRRSDQASDTAGAATKPVPPS
jgi:hypothetical protein